MLVTGGAGPGPDDHLKPLFTIIINPREEIRGHRGSLSKGIFIFSYRNETAAVAIPFEHRDFSDGRWFRILKVDIRRVSKE